MFPDKTALIKALKVLLSSNYNFYTAIYMCVLGSQKKMKLQLLLYPPQKQVETGQPFIGIFFFFKDAGVLLFAVFSQLQSRWAEPGKTQA